MKLIETVHVTHTIGEHFLLALEYGHCDDLSVDEARALVRWEACVMDGHTDNGEHWEFSHFDPSEDTDEFGLCEVSDMRGRTVTVRAVYKRDVGAVA